MPASPANFAVAHNLPLSPSAKDIGMAGKRPSRPAITPEEAARRLNNLTRAEHERVTAVLIHGSATQAAVALDCDRETVARTWRIYRGLIAIMLQEFRPQAGQPH